MQRIPIKNLNLDHDQPSFFKKLVMELGSTLEDVVGVEEASGFISIVGTTIGQDINAQYHHALHNEDHLSIEQVADILVDLKARIGGAFEVTHLSADRLELTNSACPFGESVVGKSSLCMMTSNVFGRIVADNLGYARISLPETIAKGDGGCKIIVHLQHTKEVPADSREYFEHVSDTE
ncbi:methanogen output domain 1-containing protein [Aestuariibacter salexigens]|uniref:methanogen output domain 1-containing protein n=1 Tax=Aestuariibacter salexigens TaxID=226010 RepID=UPI0004190EF8|nr:methanogen output domain 1-containing protein [Aestuariibacter salexigens]